LNNVGHGIKIDVTSDVAPQRRKVRSFLALIRNRL